MVTDFNSEIVEYVRQSLLGWLVEGIGSTSEYDFRSGMVLTPDAQVERDEFDLYLKDAGCTCFISPPCGYCVHPGNPLNQEESDECWMPITIGGAK